MISLSPVEGIARPEGSPRAAFTIIELLVAITIGIIVVILLAGIVSQSMWIARKFRSQIEAVASAAAAIDLIAADLDGLAVTRQPSEYLQAFVEPLPIGPAGATFTPMRLLMLSCSAEDASTSSTAGGIYTYPESGLVHAISYSVLFQDPLGGSSSNNLFGLYRSVASPTTTFAALLGGTNQYISFWANNAANVSALVRNPQPQSGIRADLVAPNVVDLEIAVDGNLLNAASPSILTGSTQLLNPSPAPGNALGAIQLTGTGALVGIGYNANGAITSPGAAPSAGKLPAGAGWGPAACVEVSVTVLEQEGATLWEPGANTGMPSIAALKRKYGHTLSRKILLPLPQ